MAGTAQILLWSGSQDVVGLQFSRDYLGLAYDQVWRNTRIGFVSHFDLTYVYSVPKVKTTTTQHQGRCCLKSASYSSDVQSPSLDRVSPKSRANFQFWT